MSEGGEIFLAVASRIPLLLGRLGRTVLGLALQSRRAASSFGKALRRNGVSPSLARKLTDHYRDQLSLRRLLKTVVKAARSD